ncbi:hypothetical protein OAO01_05150 [Oligoflexia bacterium]|nr:hypothetical protein [Oligoflexia bacterium]
MKKLNNLLERYLGEQVALEEQLCTVIEQQIADVDETNFPEARNVLIKTKDVLERHFQPLNGLLDKLDQEKFDSKKKGFPLRAVDISGGSADEKNRQVSVMLRDNYSLLNLIAIGNSVLHTTALALDHKDAALLALEHLKDLTPLVSRIVEIIPHIVARELSTQSERIDPAVGQIAGENLLSVWRVSN